MSQKNSLPTLCFAHANGFPKGSYTKLIKLLEADFDVIGLDIYGNNPEYTIEQNWDKLVKEYLDYLEPYDQVIGVGHSFGGLLTYLAALEKPEKFSAVISMEPPLFVGKNSGRMLKLAKKLNFIDFITPAKFSKKRREEFDSKAQALDYFNKKHFFAKFETECLKDYVECAIIEQDNNIAKLAISRDIETQLFRTIPNNLHNAHEKLEVPMAVIYAIDSNLLNTKRHLKDLRARDYFLVPTKGGHMFPMEDTQATCDLINKTLAKLLVGNSVNRYM